MEKKSGRRAFLISSSMAPVALAAQAQPLKIAVAGMAHAHVWLHLGTMLAGGPVTLAGLADNAPERLNRAKRTGTIPQSTRTRPGVPEALIFSDYRKMIDKTRPDIVWAFTETNRHIEVVEYCAPRGIHVIVEKPLAATYQEALAIRRLALEHRIHVMTNYGSIWSPAQYAVKAAVEAGAVGQVFRLRALAGHGGPGDPRKSSFAAWLADPVQNGGGALMDFGCYSVLWSLWLKGRPESVYAAANHIKPDVYPKVEDNATIILNYKDGVAILEASWALPPRPASGNEVFGTAGSIVMGRTIELRKSGAQPEEITVPPLPPERSEPVAYLVHKIRSKEPLDGMAALDINVAVNEVLEAAKMSIMTTRAVSLPLRGAEA